jgi:hypothetical protein
MQNEGNVEGKCNVGSPFSKTNAENNEVWVVHIKWRLCRKSTPSIQNECNVENKCNVGCLFGKAVMQILIAYVFCI